MSSPGDKEESLMSHCSVCGSPAAAHLHYGAVSCYSCRAFFRRGQPKQIRCIFGHGQCKISRHNRTNCKLCRYRKCLEVGMKPDKVDYYLNKRKEREARVTGPDESPGSQEYEQIPNRSPASEEQTRIKNNYSQSSPRLMDSTRKATPSPVNQPITDPITTARGTGSHVVQNEFYESSMNSHSQKINDQERNNFREQYQRMMRHSQQGYFFPSIQNEYFGTMRNINGPFNPSQSRPDSSELLWNKSENFTSPEAPPWRFGGIERALHHERNGEWEKMHTRGGNLNNLSTNDWNSWKSRSPSHMSNHSHTHNHFPNRPNQTSVIRYETNQAGMYPTGRKQEVPPGMYEDHVLKHENRKHEHYQPTEKMYNPGEEIHDIKQELSSSEDENTQMETHSSIIRYPRNKTSYVDCQSVVLKCDRTAEFGASQSNLGETTFQPYASVIKRNIEASSQKPRLHPIANFRQVEIPKPPFNSHLNSNYTNVNNEDLQEIKSEDIEADINEKFFENSDSLAKSCNENINESYNDNFKIQIPKRKPNFSSDSEEEESSPVSKERSLVPLKKRQRMLEIPYATGHAVNKKVLPVMSFTFEEEFKVVDYIVRIEQYQNRRFEFICKNFQQYKELTAAFVACTHVGRKIPFNRQLERKLFTIGLEFTKQSCKEIYEEMGMLSSDVRREVLNSTFPALYVVMYAILEGNTREKTWMDQHMKTLHITKENHAALKDYIRGLENVRSISLKDQERFTSPWAVEMADEEKFERTISLVGRLLRDDIQLQALYHMFVMMRPSSKNSDKIQLNPALAEVQIKLSQLIYRYLSTKSDFNYTKSGYLSEDNEGTRNTSRPDETSSSIMSMSEDIDDINPDEKTRLLISLVDDLHDCVDIMQNRSLLVQADVDV